MSEAASTFNDTKKALLADYVVRSGVADELFDADGQMRAVWAPFVKHLSALAPEELAERFARGDRYLRDTGVFYRQYNAEQQPERDWPLSHIPVILHESEWNEICEGLSQRAEILERLVADLYGSANLVRDGHLPPELIARNPEWLRPLVGVAPPSGHFLHLLAFEIGRSPDGSWLVLGDRAQAPSGAGFALENRMATSRIFSESSLRARVRRLAGFFRAFRDAMDALPGAKGRPTAILTPGPGTDTYFEHAYIARYLGLPLLEGEDLIVENGAVQMRTVSGPQPVGVLWRRLDAAYADPLELEETSQIGTPGLVGAMRQFNVNMVNALGSGILETRVLMAFLPKIAEILTGEALKLPNLATWWCGQESERSYVKANAVKLFIGKALSRGLPFDIGNTDGLEADKRPADQPLADWIDAHAASLVGQEAVTLSTTPTWVEGRLLPRPMSVRVFAARTPRGWTFLPGGYARIGRTGDTTALSMQQGGSVADVWVMRDGPAPVETLFDGGDVRISGRGTLPARAADNFYWLGRYIERSEGAIRLLRAYHLRLAEIGDPNDPYLQWVADLLKRRSLDVNEPLQAALHPALNAAHICAGRVRDRFSVDGWAALTELTRSLEVLSAIPKSSDDIARELGGLLRKITGFNGLVHENMHRTSGWRFLSFGRAIERADSAAAVLAACNAEESEQGRPDIALEFADSRVTHQRRYRIDPTRETVNDLVALDGGNPRAILFQIKAMRSIAEDLPFARVDGRVSPVLRALLRLETDLTVIDPALISPAFLTALQGSLVDISGRLSAAYLT